MLVNVGKLMSHTSTKGGGGVKHPFNPSLVDAWFMSGLSDNNKPSSIRGVKGNEIVLRNFAFTSESGFGEGAYEGALVFDGVDDYGICTGLPILDDYTVICKREIINKETGSVASKRTSSSQWDGAFIFERNSQLTSFGQNNYRTIQQNNVSYMTTTSYNGDTISRGALQDTDYLILGADGFNIDLNRAHGFGNLAIYYFALYDKSLTPEEIEEEKVKLENYWEGGKMNWLEIPVEDLKQFDKDWEVRRKSVDGTKALLHEEIYNELVPQVETLPEEGEPIVYPYPLLDNQMVEALLETSEWSNIDE